jgi:hypothetical protein
VFATNTTDLIIDINGYFLPQTNSTTQSTALGTGASNAGSQNTAIGYDALQVNTGNGNTATGTYALSSNASGNNNVAIGSAALDFNATGSANTAVGTQALLNNLIGNDNAAMGFNALWSNSIGSNNTAFGAEALSNNVTGSGNSALGYQAGSQITSGSNNIDIGNQGQNTDSSTIRIGDPVTHTSAYLAGVKGAIVVSGATVLIGANGQLGTVPSSRRYKEDIHDIGETSEALMKLHPVAFRYRQPAPDGNKPMQYGLIGEEVEKVYPELVIHDSDQQILSVAYHELPALLLNELQKQHRTIEELHKRIDALEKQLSH